MPELPEVETIKSQLQAFLPLEVLRVKTSKHLAAFFKNAPLPVFKKSFVIQKIERHGKELFFHLAPDFILSSHLGMSGSWQWHETPTDIAHTHLQFETSKGFLSYIDPRRFGKMKKLDQERLHQYISELPKDVSHPDFGVQDIEVACKRFPNRPIKALLLEQKYFRGVGNYIACEVCAWAGILPTRPAGELKKKDYQMILDGIRKVIGNQIALAGLTFQQGYRDAYGNKGGGINSLVVFHQKICGLCKKRETIKTVLAGRGTYHCPGCQR